MSLARNLALAALVLAFGLFAPGPAAAQKSMSNAQLLLNLDTVAFGNEYTGRRYKFVRKWKSPIRAGIKGDPPAYFEDMVRQHLADLQRSTGHSMRLVFSRRMQREKKLAKGFNPKSVNMFLLYFPLDKMEAQLPPQFGSDKAMVMRLLKTGKTPCMAKLFKKGQEIRVSIVLFPAHHPKNYMRACVVEELTQVLGLPNDSKDVKPSIFNDKSHYFELTNHDRWLLRLLYDPSIAIGMPRADALKAASQILAKLRPGR
ncbi:MAG: DUF2927 domain-containing protein [Alphaproteobacteria bacterium]|jgi:hypothetical protein|nr:DUF2927 domain-containing protein [Alphaproteobacteria bacterium]